MTADRLSQAIALARVGEKDKARQILLQILKEDLRNETAWLWLVQTLPTDSQRIAVLEQCLKNIPDSQKARQGLDFLRARQAVPAPAPSPSEKREPFTQAPQVLPPPSPAVSNVSEFAEGPFPPPMIVEPGGRHAAPGPLPPAGSPETPVRQVPPAEPLPPPLGQEPPPELPSQKKGFRLTALDIGAIIFIILLIMALAGYFLWNFGPFATSQPAQGEHAGLAATAEYLETQNARMGATLTAVQNARPTSTSLALPTQTLTPTASTTSTPTPAALSLPAPVYFISGLLGGDYNDPAPGSYQIWQLETDGITLIRISDEAARVDYLDISPLDGTLAYVSDNQLILADADGENRRIITGKPLPRDWSESYWTTEVSSPVWSPDGKRLAYGLNGVNILDTTTDSTTKLIESNIPPADKPLEIRLYEPTLWSPDGNKILTRVRGYECGEMTILPAAGGTPSAYFNEENDLFVWSNDSLSLFNANPVPGGLCGSYGGLWRVEADTGKATALVENEPDATIFYLYGWPKQTPDGRLLYFYTQGPSEALIGQTISHSLFISETDGVTGRTALSSESFYFFEENQYMASGSGAFGSVLWSPDGTFAVISAARQAGASQEFWLVRTDGSPSVKLAGTGDHLHWGVFAPLNLRRQK